MVIVVEVGVNIFQERGTKNPLVVVGGSGGLKKKCAGSISLGLDQVIKADLEIIIFVVVSGKDECEFRVSLFHKSAFFSVSNRPQVFNRRKNFSQDRSRDKQLRSSGIKNGLHDIGGLESGVSSYFRKRRDSKSPQVGGSAPQNGERDKVIRKVALNLAEKDFVDSWVE